MKNGQGFLLVFSITSRSSLNELHGLREEILRIKDRDQVPIVIIGNKADLEDQREVPRTKAFAVSQDWGAPYYEASARTRSKCLLKNLNEQWQWNLTGGNSERRRSLHRHMSTDAEGRRCHRGNGRRDVRDAIQVRRAQQEETAAEEEEGSPEMRHIMIDLFASSMGLSCPNLIFTIFPNLKDQSLPTFHFRVQDYILFRPFQKGSCLPGVKVLESLCELTH